VLEQPSAIHKNTCRSDTAVSGGVAYTRSRRAEYAGAVK
jgi:hypothetical protein